MIPTRNDSPELIILKFALPCLAMRVPEGKLTQKEYDSYEKACLSGKPPSKEILEKLLPNEHKRRLALAKKLQKSPLDREVVESYWSPSRIGHNAVIDRGEDDYRDSMPRLKEFCKVHEATILSLEDNQKFRISYQGVERVVLGILTPRAKPGDKVLVHRNFSIYQNINGQYYSS